MISTGVISQVALIERKNGDTLSMPVRQKRCHSPTDTSSSYFSLKCVKLDQDEENIAPAQCTTQDTQIHTDLQVLSKRGKVNRSVLQLKFEQTSPIKYTGPALPCQVAGYDSLTKRAVVGDEREHDHIPSAAAVRTSLEMHLQRKLVPAERAIVRRRATAVEVPKTVHQNSRTYKGRNNPAQIRKDAENLRAAAERDVAMLAENLKKEGKTPEEIRACIDQIHARNAIFGIYTL